MFSSLIMDSVKVHTTYALHSISFETPWWAYVRKRRYSIKWNSQIHAAFILFLHENAYAILLFFVIENEVFAWGNNAMGQCGQGHTSTPVTKPKKVIGLEGVSIQQITAGTSHSLAWTAVPTDRWAERQRPISVVVRTEVIWRSFHNACTVCHCLCPSLSVDNINKKPSFPHLNPNQKHFVLKWV